jgi:hypothetical protein
MDIHDDDVVLENCRILLREISEEEYQKLIDYMDSQDLDYEEL